MIASTLPLLIHISTLLKSVMVLQVEAVLAVLLVAVLLLLLLLLLLLPPLGDRIRDQDRVGTQARDWDRDKVRDM